VGRGMQNAAPSRAVRPPVLGQFAEHLAVWRAGQHAVAAALDKQPLAVIDRLLPVDPSQPFIAGRIDDEQGVEL
jgi:hypothetical protein